MSKTLNDYVDLVQKEVDDTSTGALPIIQQNVIDTVNEIYAEINEYITATITEEYTATVGKTAYPTANDSDYIEQVSYRPLSATNFQILHEISDKDYRDNFINRPNSVPTNWFWNIDEPNIAPAPSDAGTVRIVYRPHTYTTNLNDTSLIAERFTRCVLNGAIYKFKFWEQNVYASLYYQQWFEDGLRGMILDLSTRSKTRRVKFFGR